MSHISQPRIHSTVDAVRKANVKQLATDNECIQNFSRHCQSFYNSSLVLTSSSTSLDKNAGHAKSNEHKIEHGKIVMEALDRIGSIRVAAENLCDVHPAAVQRGAKESLARLRREHELVADCHRDLLDECGFLHVDRFISIDEPSSKTEASSAYMQYTQTRDSIRRKSHTMAMIQRQSSLYQLLTDNEQATTTECTATNQAYHKSMTQLKHVKHAISTTERFVQKYKQNIGSHSFLSGLYRLIHSQLHTKSKNDVVQWNFCGSVLTEACHVNADGDTETYAREAAQVLFAFLVWVKSKDVEDGKRFAEEDCFDFTEMNQALDGNEPMLSFQVNEYISNNNLRRILSVLPNPKDLDARATGQIEVNEVKGRRVNVDGRLDEKWPWWQDLCNLL